MSLIHEALEKVEQEKKETPLGNETLPLTPPKTLTRENTRVVLGIVAFLLFCFVLGMIYLFAGSHSSQGERPETKTSTSAPIKPNRFSLTGITRMGNDRNAIINNQLVRVGDWVSGARVDRIEEEEVQLEDQGQFITLDLYEQGTAHLTRLENP